MFTKKELNILVEAMEMLINKTPSKLSKDNPVIEYIALYNKIKEMTK